MKVAYTPDGTMHQFPDNMDDGQINTIIQKYMGVNKEPSFTDKLGQLAQDPRALFDQSMQGMIPAADEATSFLTAGALKGYDALRGAFGGEQQFAGQSFGDIYNEAQQIQNDRLQQERDKYGAATLVPNIVGGVLSAPILGAIGKTAPLEKAANYVGQASASLGRIGQAAAKGAAGGAALGTIYGAGEGSGSERIQNAAIGGGAGLILGGALGGAVSGVESGYNGIKNIASSAATQGKNVVDDVVNATTDAQKFLQENITPSQATRALREQAVMKGRTGVDMPIAGIMPDNANIQTYADLYAVQPETVNIAKQGINAVGESIDQAKNKWISGISNGTASKQDAAELFRSSTGDIRDSIMQAAKQEAKPLYNQAFKVGDTHRIVPDEQLNILKDSVKFQQIANAVKSNDLYANVPENSVEFLDGVRSYVMKRAQRATDSADAAGLDILSNNINKVITSSLDDSGNKALSTARNIYSVGKTEEKILDSSPLGRVLKATEFDAMKGINQLASADAKYISQAKQQFLSAGKEQEWNAMARAFVEDKFDNVVENSARDNLRDLLFKTKNQQAAMHAMLGNDSYKGLKAVAGAIDKYKVLKSYNRQSATQSRQATRSASDAMFQTNVGKALNVAKIPLKAYGAVKNAVTAPQQTLERYESLTVSKDSMRELARYLFTPEGKQELIKIAGQKTPAAKQAAAMQLVSRLLNSPITEDLKQISEVK